MCIILDNSVGAKIPLWLVENMLYENQDGYAHIDLETGKIIRTMDEDEIRKVLKNGGKYLFHARKTTTGKTCLENCHLIPVANDWHLMMNGTVRGFGGNDVNDTHEIADTLRLMPEKNVLKFLNKFDARFLVVNSKSKKFYKTGEWHNLEFDGKKVWLSKDNVLKECNHRRHKAGRGYNSHLPERVIEQPISRGRSYDRYGSSFRNNSKGNLLLPSSKLVGESTPLFVYNDLKKDFPYHSIIEHCEFLGKGVTRYQYPMALILGNAHLFGVRSKEGHQIKGEVYSVDKPTLDRLKLFHAVGKTFDLREIEIQVHNQKMVCSTLASKSEEDHLTYISEYINP